MIVIDKIRKSYDRHADKYDSGTRLQRGLADKLLNAVEADAVKFSKVLDIGCGTGYLARQIRNKVVFGCDISFGMLSCAKNKSNTHYVQSNAAILPFSDSVFDLVVSNAAYQWVFDLKSAFKEARRVLKPRGKFYFVAFNKNTLRELQSACKGINIASVNFPDENKVSLALREAGFKISSIEIFTYEKYYNDLWELLGALKNIGSTSAENKDIKGLAWRKIINQANELYLEKFGDENGIPATYEAFLVKAENE